LEAAQKECREAIRLDPELAEAYLTLGNICLDLDEAGDALRNYEKFLACEHSPAAREIREEVAALIEGLKEEL
jgi:tetratricopeptide (TPR) repeat protein